MRIVGISDTHNAASCIVEDGVVVSARQEERITRVKNEHRFPSASIRWNLAERGLSPDDVDVVALSSFHVNRPYTREDLLEWFERLESPATRLRRIARRTPLMDARRRARRAERLGEITALGFPEERIALVDHHTCHAAAGYHGAGWDADPVLVLTLDGEGDGLCGSVRIGRDGRLERPLATIAAPDSIGAVYTLVTHLLGMVPLEHEYKLMGLAPYAPEKGAARSYEAFADMLTFTDDGLSWRRSAGWPDLFFSRPVLEERLRFHRFDWVAAGLQRYLEEHVVAWARNALAATGLRRLALSGGVFMNVKLNKRLAELDEVDDLFVYPSCGDETNAMGAAWYVQERLDERAGRSTSIPPVGGVYFGAEPTIARDDEAITALVADGYTVQEPDDVEDAVADLLAAGEVVARAQGREEFGARALGNRSILADPTIPGVVRTINDMIKNRDFWMPFAPAMLDEDAEKYIENPKNLRAPYMILAFDSSERVTEYPAAVHPSDRTARPQVVSAAHNPAFHHLLTCFRRRTGRSVLLNTSFNLHGFPIVSSAADAIAVLRGSGLDHLALDGLLISKPGAAPNRP